MTPNEMTELIDLYAADELPDALRGLVESLFSAEPRAAHDAQTLRAALDRLRAAPAERPDVWFTERLLNTLLRDSVATAPALVNQ